MSIAGNKVFNAYIDNREKRKLLELYKVMIEFTAYSYYRDTNYILFNIAVTHDFLPYLIFGVA